MSSKIGDALRWIRENEKINIDMMASKLGVNKNTLGAYERGERLPDIDFLIGFTDKNSTDFIYLLELRLKDSPASGAADVIAMMDSIGNAMEELADIKQGRDSTQPSPAAALAAPDGFILVPRYDVAASMGNGAVIHSEQVVDHLAFRAEWVRTELGTNPNNLVLISAIGDSMEPTLRAGDLLLIDRSGAGVKQDAIYAFATNGELRVKRMQLKIDGSVVVKSDNPQYDAEVLAADDVAALRIVGRVVWSGRRM